MNGHGTTLYYSYKVNDDSEIDILNWCICKIFYNIINTLYLINNNSNYLIKIIDIFAL